MAFPTWHAGGAPDVNLLVLDFSDDGRHDNLLTLTLSVPRHGVAALATAEARDLLALTAPALAH